AASNEVNDVGRKSSIKLTNNLNMPDLEDISIFEDSNEDVGEEADVTNMDTNINIYRNKKDERGIVVRNKARLVAQSYTQEEEIDYDEVFALVVMIEEIRLFLAYVSFKDFVVYQMDVKSAFLYCTIEDEVYVCQPLGFEDPKFPDIVYKKDDGIFTSQDKYVDEILKKFGFLTVKIASTPIETLKPLMKDENAEDVDVHLYRSRLAH
nr:copia protein [Tanacetum cinerariifolium]